MKIFAVVKVYYLIEILCCFKLSIFPYGYKLMCQTCTLKAAQSSSLDGTRWNIERPRETIDLQKKKNDSLGSILSWKLWKVPGFGNCAHVFVPLGHHAGVDFRPFSKPTQLLKYIQMTWFYTRQLLLELTLERGRRKSYAINGYEICQWNGWSDGRVQTFDIIRCHLNDGHSLEVAHVPAHFQVS